MCYSTKHNILGQTIYTVTHARSCQIMQGFFPPSFNSKAMCYLALFPCRPSPTPVFHHLQYMQAIKNWKLYASNQRLEAACKQSKTGSCMQAIKDWRLYASNQRLEAACKQSKTGSCMQAIKDWRLYASNQRLEAVCKQSKTGGCMQAIKDWRLYASNQKLEPVCKQSKTGGCMQAIKDWRLYAKTGGGEGLHDAM